jgi:hypothetical protein
MDSRLGVEWLVAKTLTAALKNRKGDDRFMVLEAMTSLAILHPTTIPALIPDLPELVAKNLQDGDDATRSGIVFLAAALHTSPAWVEQNWQETAELMSRSMGSEGDVLAVLKGIDIVLDAL